MRVHIELPCDRGHQWHLVAGEETAVLSEHAALTLAIRFKIPIPTHPSLINGFVDQGEDYKISKKARRMLESSGIGGA